MFGLDWLSLPGLAFGFLTGGTGLAVPAIGAGASVLATFFRGTGKWLLLLVAFLALGSWGAAQRVHVGDLRAERAELQGKLGVATLERDQARANSQLVAATNAQNVVELAAIRAQNDRALVACGAEIGRLAQQKQRTRIITQRIHDAPDCKGVPDAYRAVFDELRQRDAADDRDRQHQD